MPVRRCIATIWIVIAFACAAVADNERTVTKLTDGVYAIEHHRGPDQLQSGNTTVIIGDRQVLVVDTCFQQSVARGDIALIRQWTRLPVTFILNTHFHNDHNLGNRAYMEAFPQVTIIAQVETKKSMDMYGPGSSYREEKGLISLRKMLETGKDGAGTPLTDADRVEVRSILDARVPVIEELKQVRFQSATLTFDHDFTIDLGNREVQIKFLGRGNTAGDAVAYLPKEKIVVAGDLVAYPTPNMIDGYPTEWLHTMEKLEALDFTALVPGHGPVLHDKKYVSLIHDLLQSAIEQVNSKLSQTGPPWFESLDDVKAAVDLSAFRPRFAADDKDAGERFGYVSNSLIKLVYQEAGLR